jgi:hypothetical protein
MMSTASASAAAGGPGRLNRLMIWLGHYSPQISVPITIATWVFIVSGWWIPTGAITPVAAGVLFGAIVVLVLLDIAGMICQSVHDRNLCLQELQEAPLLDPQGAVEKNRHLLEFYHRHRRSPLTLIISLSPIAAMLIMAGNHDAALWLKIPLTAVAAIGVALASYLGRVRLVHTRLYPWCPWCHRDDGPGDHMSAPTPDPVGNAQR